MPKEMTRKLCVITGKGHKTEGVMGLEVLVRLMTWKMTPFFVGFSDSFPLSFVTGEQMDIDSQS